jgi:hypothetical protein
MVFLHPHEGCVRIGFAVAPAFFKDFFLLFVLYF